MSGLFTDVAVKRQYTLWMMVRCTAALKSARAGQQESVVREAGLGLELVLIQVLVISESLTNTSTASVFYWISAVRINEYILIENTKIKNMHAL